MGYGEIAEILGTGLGLDLPPVGLAFVPGAPDGIPLFEGAVPSACALWRRAETGLFYAPAAVHANCPVGMLTMGFALPPEVQGRLGEAVALMSGCGYLEEAEAARLPSVTGGPAGIVYGPLRLFPRAPDAVLLWLTPAQAMLFGEGSGRTRWAAPAPLPVLGRPTCAAIPLALRDVAPALSLGCAGMRIYTGIGTDRLLAVVPGANLATFADGLAATLAANGAMRAYYEAQRARF